MAADKDKHPATLASWVANLLSFPKYQIRGGGGGCSIKAGSVFQEYSCTKHRHQFKCKKQLRNYFKKPLSRQTRQDAAMKRYQHTSFDKAVLGNAKISFLFKNK